MFWHERIICFLSFYCTDWLRADQIQIESKDLTISNVSDLKGQPQEDITQVRLHCFLYLGGQINFWNLPWAPEALPDFSILTSVLFPQLHQEVEILMKQNKEILQTWYKFNFKQTKLHLMQIMYMSSWILDKSLHLKNKQKFTDFKF